MLPSAIVIPTGVLGAVLEPAALFAAWGAAVVGVLAMLSAALGREAWRCDAESRVDQPQFLTAHQSPGTSR